MQKETYMTGKSFKHSYKELTEEKRKSYIAICVLNWRENSSHARDGKPEISEVDLEVHSLLYFNRKSNILVNIPRQRLGQWH